MRTPRPTAKKKVQILDPHEMGPPGVYGILRVGLTWQKLHLTNIRHNRLHLWSSLNILPLLSLSQTKRPIPLALFCVQKAYLLSFTSHWRAAKDTFKEVLIRVQGSGQECCCYVDFVSIFRDKRIWGTQSRVVQKYKACRSTHSCAFVNAKK